MYRHPVVLLLLLSWTWSFGNGSLSIVESTDLLSAAKQQKHMCIFGCEFIIPFGAPLVLPSSCRQEATENACEIQIRVELSLNFTRFSFPSSTINLTVGNDLIANASVDLIDFYFDDNLIAYTLAYQCSFGDKCEWNYVEKKLPSIINRDYRPLYNSVSALLYGGKTQPNVTHCYSLDEPTECQSGVCDFTEAFDEDTLTLTSIRECLVFDRPKLFFGQYRFFPDPMKYNHDYLYFACNIHECNSPSNERAIKQLIENHGWNNDATMPTGRFHAVFTFYLIVSIFLTVL